MGELKVIEYKNVRVLTTQQIAEVYEAEERRIVDNFNRNKSRYQEGKHFVCLVGDDLRDFRAKTQIEVLQNANKLYIWTEKGAFLHAKSLNTDKAWEVYDRLVDSYFTKKPLTQLEILQQSVDILNRHEEEIKQIDGRMDKLEFDIPLYGSEADELSGHVRRKGVKVLGGKQSDAYKDSEIRSKVYRDIYDQLRREFGIFNDSGHYMTYKALKRKYLADAHEFIDCYSAPKCLIELINNANAQTRLDIA